MAEVTFVPNHVPAPACYPPDFNALLDELTTGGGLSGTIPDNAGGGIFVGSSPPSSSLTNKVWFQIDAAGRPLMVKMFYNGNWRRVYAASYGDIKLYIGGFNGVFDGSGLGIIGGFEDGWALCNGQNGTPYLEGYFPCGAAWNGSAWIANPEGTGSTTTGGARQPSKIAASNLPQLSVDLWNSDTSQSGGTLPNPAYAGNGTQAISAWFVHETLNSPNTPLPGRLWSAMAFLMFVGYQ